MSKKTEKAKAIKFADLVQGNRLAFLDNEATKPFSWSEEQMYFMTGGRSGSKELRFNYRLPGSDVDTDDQDHIPSFTTHVVKFESDAEFDLVRHALQGQSTIPHAMKDGFGVPGFPREWGHPAIFAIRDAKKLVALTGAGISVSSGVPAFRSGPGAIWESVDMSKFAIDYFRKNPKQFWKNLDTIRKRISTDVQPTPAHQALAKWEENGLLKAVITQNVDGLHQKAGSKNVIEIHGNLREAICLSCGTIEPLDIEHAESIPSCKRCRSILKPNSILFGETLPEKAVKAALKALKGCDVLVVVGTSHVVTTANAIMDMAGLRNATIVEINPERTIMAEEVSPDKYIHIQEAADQAFSFTLGYIEQCSAYQAAKVKARHIDETEPLELQVLEVRDEIWKAEWDMAWMFRAKFNARPVKATITYPGGKDKRVVYWSDELGIWGCFWRFPAGDRYVNCFGTTKPVDGKQLKITTEINVPVLGVNSRMQGAFAKNLKSGTAWLVHRGGGIKGPAGTRKDFGDVFHGQKTLMKEGQKLVEVFVIGCVEDPELPQRITEWVRAVEQYKGHAATPPVEAPAKKQVSSRPKRKQSAPAEPSFADHKILGSISFRIHPEFDEKAFKRHARSKSWIAEQQHKAEQGDADAAYHLGLMYSRGVGLAKNIRSADKWLKEAFVRQNQHSLFQFGTETVMQLCFAREYWDEGKIGLATKCLRAAAEQGHLSAQWNLAMALMFGPDSVRDFPEAARQLRKLSNQGDIEAGVRLAPLLIENIGTADAIQEAVSILKRLAADGIGDAQNYLGFCYQNGYGVQRDDAMAADWFLKAAKKNNATAQYNLAGAYAMGKGVTQNIREGLRWLQKAADQKHPDAFLTLGVVYSSGEFMPPDLPKAYAYLEVAMDLGKEQALMAVPQVWQAMSESQQEHATVLGKELHERYGVINPRENFDWSQIETDEKAIQIKRKSAKINGTEKEATGSSSRNDKKTRS